VSLDPKQPVFSWIAGPRSAAQENVTVKSGWVLSEAALGERLLVEAADTVMQSSEIYGKLCGADKDNGSVQLFSHFC
jgi:hypothetical protein